MFEIASFLPKLEMLASTLTGVGLTPPKTCNSGSKPYKAKKQRKALSKKIILVRKPTNSEPTVTQHTPPFGQPGMVYVPASWVKKNPFMRDNEDQYIKHTQAILAKKRKIPHLLQTDQNILVRGPPKNRIVKKKPNTGKLLTEVTLKSDAKIAAVTLEKKRLEFLQYLQGVHEELSALKFSGKIKKKAIKKRKETQPKSKQMNRIAIKSQGDKRKEKTGVASKKTILKVEHQKRKVKSVSSKAVAKSNRSLASMLSQDSSSTQIKMMDDAFSSNHRKL